MGNQQGESRGWNERAEESIKGEIVVGITSHGRTICDKREFLLPLGLGIDQFAEAGVMGVLNTFLSERGVVGDIREEIDDDTAERTVDSPTNVFSAAIMPWYSKLEVSPSPIGFQGSLYCVGEPIVEDDTEAPDSDEAERTGGCSWNECDVEWGEPAGVWNWNGLTPWAMAS
jgi:hypothetical protein